MEWYKILIEVVLGLGGLAGIGAFVKIFLFVKQEKKSKEIENKGSEIENLHKIIGDYRDELEWFKKDFKDYKEAVDKRITFFKGQYEHLELRIDILNQAVSEAYRCTYPATIDDCPVIKSLKQSKKCEECRKKGADECLECKEE
jgi:hypothetical protein